MNNYTSGMIDVVNSRVKVRGAWDQLKNWTFCKARWLLSKVLKAPKRRMEGCSTQWWWWWWCVCECVWVYVCGVCECVSECVWCGCVCKCVCGGCGCVWVCVWKWVVFLPNSNSVQEAGVLRKWGRGHWGWGKRPKMKEQEGFCLLDQRIKIFYPRMVSSGARL